MKQKTSFRTPENLLQTIKTTWICTFIGVLNSTAFPHRLVELALACATYLQALKFSFDYFGHCWSLGERPVVLFSYLDPAYYLTMLSDNSAINAMYLSLGLMLLYMLLTVWLLLPFNRQVYNKTSAAILIPQKILKVLLNLYCSVLMIPSVRAIVNYHSCKSFGLSEKIKTLPFKCIEDTNAGSVILSTVILIAFLMLLFMQCLIKHDFVHSTSGMRRYYSRGVCLFLAYTIANEVSTLTNVFGALLILNITALLLTAYSRSSEDYQDTTAYKLEQSFLAMNLLLIMLVDINYFLAFSIPAWTWLCCVPFIFFSVWFSSQNEMEYMIANINKFTNTFLTIRYCRKLSSLLFLPPGAHKEMALGGYVDVHRQRCEEPECPIRMSAEQIAAFREHLNQNQTTSKRRNTTCKNLSTAHLLVQESLKKIFVQSVKYFQADPSILLEFAQFLYSIGLKEQAFQHLLHIVPSLITYEQQYKLERLKLIIQAEINEHYGDTSLDMLRELEVRKLQEKLLAQLEEATSADFEFWTVLIEDHPDMTKLQQLGTARVRYGEQVRKTYEEISSIGNSQRCTSLYLQFLLAVDRYQQQACQVQAQLINDCKLKQKVVMKDWANSSSCVFLFSGDDDKYGTIIDLNLSAACRLGFEKYELLNRHVSMLFPPLLCAPQSTLFDLNCHDQRFFVSHKSGYFLPVKRSIALYNDINHGVIFMCTLEIQSLTDACFFLVDKNDGLKIRGISSNCVSNLDMDIRFVGFKDTLDSIFPWLAKRLDSLLQESKEIRLEDQLDPEVIEKGSIDPSFFQGRFNVRVENLLSTGCVVVWFHSIRSALQHNIVSMRRDSQGYENVVKATQNLQTGELVYEIVKQPYWMDIAVTAIQFLVCSQEEVQEEHIEMIYGDDIRMVRLYDSGIEVIEADEEREYEKQESLKSSQIETYMKLGKQEKELIFENKSTFAQFLEQHRIGKALNRILGTTFLLHLIIMSITHIVYTNHLNQCMQRLSYMVHQNLKSGEIQALRSYVLSLDQIQQPAFSYQLSQEVVTFVRDSSQTLQSIKSLGSSQYTLNVWSTDSTQAQLYSQDFFDLLVNHANMVSTTFTGANTRNDIQAARNSSPSVELSTQFIRSNGEILYSQMISTYAVLENEMKKTISQMVLRETVIFTVGYLLELIFVVLVFYELKLISQEKIKILKIFLTLGEQDIIFYQRKAEQYLSLLHVDDNDEQDDDDPPDTASHQQMTSMRRKFKDTQQDRSIYFKLLYIPLVAQIYFALSYSIVQSRQLSLSDSLRYINETSVAKATIFNALSSIQQANLANTQIKENPAQNLITFYESLLQHHYNSGLSDQFAFHKYFVNLMMVNVCDGVQTIPFACRVDLARNGTLALFTSLTLSMAYWDGLSGFDNDFYWTFKIVGKVHWYLSNKLLQSYTNDFNAVCTMLFNLIFIFSFVCLALFGIYGYPMTYDFIEKVNLTKKMLNLLPLSFITGSEEAQGLCHQIAAKSKSSC